MSVRSLLVKILSIRPVNCVLSSTVPVCIKVAGILVRLVIDYLIFVSNHTEVRDSNRYRVAYVASSTIRTLKVSASLLSKLRRMTSYSRVDVVA